MQPARMNHDAMCSALATIATEGRYSVALARKPYPCPMDWFGRWASTLSLSLLIRQDKCQTTRAQPSSIMISKHGILLIINSSDTYFRPTTNNDFDGKRLGHPAAPSSRPLHVVFSLLSRFTALHQYWYPYNMPSNQRTGLKQPNSMFQSLSSLSAQRLCSGCGLQPEAQRGVASSSINETVGIGNGQLVARREGGRGR